MGYANNPTKRVQLSDENYYVDLYSTLTYGQQRAFAKAQEAGDFPADVVLGALIAAWNLDDEAGQVLPINQENIDKLSMADAEIVLNAVMELLNVDEEARRNLSSVSSKASKEA